MLSSFTTGRAHRVVYWWVHFSFPFSFYDSFRFSQQFFHFVSCVRCRFFCAMRRWYFSHSTRLINTPLSKSDSMSVYVSPTFLSALRNQLHSGAFDASHWPKLHVYVGAGEALLRNWQRSEHNKTRKFSIAVSRSECFSHNVHSTKIRVQSLTSIHSSWTRRVVASENIFYIWVFGAFWEAAKRKASFYCE